MITHTDLIFLVGALILLVFLSGFFSASETAMMSLNRYRLRHLARQGQRSAIRIQKLLERPDRLLGVILIGSTFANICASSIATLIAEELFGSLGVVLTAVGLTFVVLIFAEMAPKTFAVIHSQRVAFIVALPLWLLLKILYPIVWVANIIANGVLCLFGVSVGKKRLTEHLNTDELRTVVHESVNPEGSDRLSGRHKDMLLGVLDLSHTNVEDVMVPRNEVIGLDLNLSWEATLKSITSGIHTRLPVYFGNLEKTTGILHLRDAVKLMSQNRLTRKTIIKAVREPYFIPEGTSLQTQLQEFRQHKRRAALVVDEYGDILGLITLEDILEEIVGELDADIMDTRRFVTPEEDGGYLIDGAVLIRELNRSMNWHLPINGPKTVSGLVLEWLETIPTAEISLMIDRYRIEVVEVRDNRVLRVRIYPPVLTQQ